MTDPFVGLRKNHYGVVLAGPPWRFQTYSSKGWNRSNVRHYPILETADIVALPVKPLAADDCCLFLWTSDPLLPEALEVIRAWGFEYKTVGFYWVKSRFDQPSLFPLPFRPTLGLGYWTRANPEMCLLATRGNPKRKAADVRRLIVAPRREHSRKPDQVNGEIERLVPGPYLELFARRRATGWDTWGDEVERFSETA